MSQQNKPGNLGVRFRPKRLEAAYDALIIGSGMGGLSCAALLADMGWKVAVLEQHYTAGGYTHSYEIEGYVFDVGVHYIGDMGTRTMARKIMDYMTDSKVRWAAMDKAYDRYIIGQKSYEVMAGRQEFEQQLLKQFPEEAQAITAYMQLLKQAGQAMSWYTLKKMMGSRAQRVGRPFLQRKIPEFLFETTAEVLGRLTSNQELLAVLTGQYGDNGLPPGKSAFMIHALIARHYLYGGYYPEGGSWKIAEALLEKIQNAGGAVYTYARVERILIDNDRVVGVKMQGGHVIAAPVVISSAGVSNTFRELVEPEIANRFGYIQRLQHVSPSLAHIGLYIGLEGDAEALDLPKQNLWIYPGTDHDAATQAFLENPEAALPVVYISFPSRKDPQWSREHPGRSTIEVVAPAPWKLFAQWEGTVWGKRGADYDKYKAMWGERLLEVVYQHLPQIRGKIKVFDVSTPLSTQWFAGWNQGELYGLDHDPQRFRQDWLRPATDIPGLWLTGQDILSCGVVGAMMSGVMTAVSVSGWRKSIPLLTRILRH